MARTNDFTYTVTEKIAIISQNGANTLELRKVSYNGAEPKLDVRRWWTDDKGVEHMGKGLTLTDKELESLAAIVVQDYLDKNDSAEEDEKPAPVKVTQFKPKTTTTRKTKSTTTTTRKPKSSSNTDIINLPFK